MLRFRAAEIGMRGRHFVASQTRSERDASRASLNMGTDFDAALIAPLPESSSRRHFATFIFRLSALTPGSQARRREHLRSAFTWTTVHDCRVIIATSECRVGVFVPRTGHDEANDPEPAAVTQALQSTS